MSMYKELKTYGRILARTSVYDENDTLLYKKIECYFYDEYDEKRDMTPIRKLKILEDKKGFYVLHKHQKYYLEKENQELKSQL